jgi:hypothetical protein
VTIDSYEAIIATVSDEDATKALEELKKELSSTDALDALVDTYLKDGVSLVLGAGVSASCGAPSWTELLLRLHATAAKNRSVDLSGLSSVYAESVATDGPLISARLAAVGVDDSDDAFKESLRKEIYGSLSGAPSELVKELARLAQMSEGRAGVKAVLTYNYDTLLEGEFDALGRQYRRLDRNDRGGQHGIEVRHVHGFLGRTKLDAEWVVLTERAYHAEYASPFSWSNIVQLNAFRESSCLFVGLSMTDPNLRRLLEAAKQTATPKHCCFLRKTSAEALQDYLDAHWARRGRPKDVDKQRLGARFEVAAAMADASRAAALRELGVQTIWYEEHDKLPPLIKSVREGKKGVAP